MINKMMPEMIQKNEDEKMILKMMNAMITKMIKK